MKLFWLVLLSVAGPVLAQSSAAASENSVARGQASLDLPRIKSKGKAGEVAPLIRSKFSVDELAPRGDPGIKIAVRQDVICLSVDPGKQWARPLRGASAAVTFASFLAYCSVGSTIEIGSAKLSVQADSKPGYALLKVDGGTRAVSSESAMPNGFSAQIKLETHEGRILAALPVITVRLDPTADVWNLYFFQQLVADDFQLAAGNGARRFSLIAGNQGALIANLTLSDDNPLFVDRNVNGIDDAFELQKRGGYLLPNNSPESERKALIGDWRVAQAAGKVATWKVRRPVPDAAVSITPSK